MRKQTSVNQVEFNPKSFDAQIATLHATILAHNLRQSERMDTQDTTLARIEKQTTITNGRVTMLEGRWKTAVAYFAGASAAILLFLKAVASLFHISF